MKKELHDDETIIMGMGKLSDEQKELFFPKIYQDYKRTENYLRRTKTIAKKLSKHRNLYSFTKLIYRNYWNIAGNFHVLPDFLIFAAGRAGTTSLYEGLVEHPDIYRARIKEIYFFDVKFQRGIGWYRSRFPSIWTKLYKTKILKKQFITGEGTPRLLTYPHAPKRVSKILPNVKLIAILRNPIDRAYSHYYLGVANGREKLSFEESIKQEEKRLEGEMEKMEKDENYYNPEFFRKSYLFQGIYINALERWMKFFPQEQFFIINGDEFYEEPFQVFDKLHKFLGVSKFRPKHYVHFNSREYSSMKESTRKYLIEFYKPYNERLSKLLRQNFDWNK